LKICINFSFMIIFSGIPFLIINHMMLYTKSYFFAGSLPVTPFFEYINLPTNGCTTIIIKWIRPYTAKATSFKRCEISGYCRTEVVVNYSGLSIIMRRKFECLVIGQPNQTQKIRRDPWNYEKKIIRVIICVLTEIEERNLL